MQVSPLLCQQTTRLEGSHTFRLKEDNGTKGFSILLHDGGYDLVAELPIISQTPSPHSPIKSQAQGVPFPRSHASHKVRPANVITPSGVTF